MGRRKKSSQTAQVSQQTANSSAPSQQSAPIAHSPDSAVQSEHKQDINQHQRSEVSNQSDHGEQDGNQIPAHQVQYGRGRGNSASPSYSPGGMNGPGAIPRGRGRSQRRGAGTRNEKPFPTSPTNQSGQQSVSTEYTDFVQDDFPALGESRFKRRGNLQTGQVVQQIDELQIQEQGQINSLQQPQPSTPQGQLHHIQLTPPPTPQQVPQQQLTPPLNQQGPYKVATPLHHQVQQDIPNQVLQSAVATPQQLLNQGIPQPQVQYQVSSPQQQMHQVPLTPPPQHLPIQVVTPQKNLQITTNQVDCPAQQQPQKIQTTPQPKQQQQKLVTPQPVLPNATKERTVEEVPANFRRGGTLGRKIQVLANHFELRLSPDIKKAFQYDVTIEPDKPKKLLPIVMQQMQRNYYPKNNPAYDGMKNLFSAYELPLSLPFSGDVKVMEDDREKEYHVRIQLAAIVDLTALTRFFNQKFDNQMVPPMHVLQCLDIVLRSRPSTTMITAGRSYFSVPEEIVRLGNGMEMYRGFYQSAILGWKPFLNVDVSHKAFPSNITLIDLIKEIDPKTDFTKQLLRYVENKLAKYIYNLKIEYKLPHIQLSKRTYRCHGLEKNANTYIFTNDKGNELNVTTYFKEEKKYKLKYPQFPCLWVGNKNRKPKIVLPLELCTIIGGQVTNKKMDESQTRNMIRNATTSTGERKEHIERSMKVASHNLSPVMQEFGLSVDSEMTEVTGRILSPPTIKYQNGNQQVVKGMWKNGHFYAPATLTKWVILCLDPRVGEARLIDLRDQLIRQGTLWSMNITSNVKMHRINADLISDENMISVIYNQFSHYRSEKMQIIFVVLNDRVYDCYGLVKRTAELHIGCMTQCVRTYTLSRLNLRTVDNILLKANVKLNGVNHVWMERPMAMNRPAIIMGADVTHPGPEAGEHIPSVAAVTASQDPQAAVYNIIWRLQDPRTEIIADLETITRKQLMTFYEKTRYKPEKIIFYRDGVSDGQFEQVRKMEIQAVRNACSSLNPQYKPAITFLVVQKRHHTRLFPCNSKDSEDKNGNVPAGTCVDTKITHPITQDFYLVSHASIQGVAKPTKYRTLWDDNNLTDDQIEQLTYFLCHMFARCNRSVSYPAPTFYAHLAAARAKVYIEENRVDLTDLSKLQDQLKISVEIQENHPMFFV